MCIRSFSLHLAAATLAVVAGCASPRSDGPTSGGAAAGDHVGSSSGAAPAARAVAGDERLFGGTILLAPSDLDTAVDASPALTVVLARPYVFDGSDGLLFPDSIHVRTLAGRAVEGRVEESHQPNDGVRVYTFDAVEPISGWVEFSVDLSRMEYRYEVPGEVANDGVIVRRFCAAPFPMLRARMSEELVPGAVPRFRLSIGATEPVAQRMPSGLERALIVRSGGRRVACEPEGELPPVAQWFEFFCDEVDLGQPLEVNVNGALVSAHGEVALRGPDGGPEAGAIWTPEASSSAPTSVSTEALLSLEGAL